MAVLTLAAACEGFGRDLEENFASIGRLIAEARDQGAALLALPEASIGGYLSSLGEDGRPPKSLPPAIRLDGPELGRVRELAGDMVVVLGICEADGPAEDPVRYNTVVALTGAGILGSHRKVHQPLGENLSYAAGDGFRAIDTPVGRIGLMICYDKAFPEGARALALDGAEIIVCVSAWPASRTASATDLAEDRWTRRFILFDQARALENQVVWVTANQAGSFHSLRFVGNAAIVGPGGDTIASTGIEAGLAVATVDVQDALFTARRAMFHLRDRRPEAYDVPEAAHA